MPANFCEVRLRRFSVVRGRILAFPLTCFVAIKTRDINFGFTSDLMLLDLKFSLAKI